MWSKLLQLKNDLDRKYTVLLMDEHQLEQPRRFLVRPMTLVRYGAVGFGMLAVGLVLLIVFVPAGSRTGPLQQYARENARKMAELEDSLESQRQYLTVLQYLVTGQVDSDQAAHLDSLIREPGTGTMAAAGSVETEDNPKGSAAVNEDEQEHLDRSSMISPLGSSTPDPGFPGLPPVKGFLTRGYDAQTGHLAIDLAVPEGTPVRTVAEGYVVFSDWTKDTGNVLVIQHNNGYLSVYKHNQKLLKRPGEHVRGREIVAVSGNSGEITTGPHVHFELWRNGEALDPSPFLRH